MQDPLSRIDLNLLVAFQVIMQEQNVTRAAERLFVTQPAMSKTLNRLRTLFKDDLFVRSSHGLSPTAKAEELEGPITDVINQLTNLMIDVTEFDPASTSATISIASLGTTSSIALPGFLNRVSKEAPQLFVMLQNIDQLYTDQLRSGNLDFAIVTNDKFGPEFITHKLVSIEPMLYMRKEHPLANKDEITLEERRNYQHLAVYFPNFETRKEEVGKLFASFGIASNVQFLSTNVFVALESMRNSDMLMIASNRLAKSQLVKESFIAKPLTSAIKIRAGNILLVQHVRTKNSALHKFLVKMLIESFADDPFVTRDL